jgi:hypothetical protein
MTQIGHVLRFLEDTERITGREGYLLLESTQNIHGWASQIDNLSLDPSLQVSSSAVASRILVPSSVSNEKFSTSLLIVNASAHDGQVNILVRSQDGSTQATQSNLNSAANGYLLFEDFYKSIGLSTASGPLRLWP